MQFAQKRATLRCKGRFQLLRTVWLSFWAEKLAENNSIPICGQIFLKQRINASHNLLLLSLLSLLSLVIRRERNNTEESVLVKLCDPFID